DYQLLPLGLVTANQEPPPQPLDHRLGVGDRLAAILTLPDLARLLRRERAPANWTVEATSIPLPARDGVSQQLQTNRGLSPEEANRALEQLPVCVGANLTRGQAEDLLVWCGREKVVAQLKQAELVLQ